MARAREKAAADDAAAARDGAAALEAQLAGAAARCDALGGKVAASREARLVAQQALDEREAQLREARRELAVVQGQLATSLEQALARGAPMAAPTAVA